MAFLLGCEKVSVEFPTKTVFEGLSLGVDEGARIGIVGQNGDGKSTLLRVLSGDVEVDDGRVIRTRGVSVGVLGQSDDLRDADTVERAVVGDRPRIRMGRRPSGSRHHRGAARGCGLERDGGHPFGRPAATG